MLTAQSENPDTTVRYQLNPRPKCHTTLSLTDLRCCTVLQTKLLPQLLLIKMYTTLYLLQFSCAALDSHERWSPKSQNRGRWSVTNGRCSNWSVPSLMSGRVTHPNAPSNRSIQQGLCEARNWEEGEIWGKNRSGWKRLRLSTHF